jgi:hypothetical protein
MSEQASKGSLKNIGIIIAALGAVGLLIWSWNANMSLSPVKLGYYCLSCKKTEDLSAYRDDYPTNWRQYPRAMSDSVLYCVLCKKGPAHPVNECETCGSVFILHLFPKYDEFGSPSCPKCDDAYGQAAKVKKIDLMPKALNP